MTTESKRIQELRNELLKLGQSIVIPGSEQKQPETADERSPTDIIIYPYFVKG